MTALFQHNRTRITVEALKLSKEADIDSYRRILLLTFFLLGYSRLNHQSEERLCNFPLKTSYTQLVLRETNFHVTALILVCVIPPINVSRENTFPLES